LRLGPDQVVEDDGPNAIHDLPTISQHSRAFQDHVGQAVGLGGIEPVLCLVVQDGEFVDRSEVNCLVIVAEVVETPRGARTKEPFELDVVTRPRLVVCKSGVEGSDCGNPIVRCQAMF
jgi:hypothetical protein